MPRLSEGRALSPLMIDPFPSGFAWLTLALPVGAISMKIGSSPLGGIIALTNLALSNSRMTVGEGMTAS